MRNLKKILALALALVMTLSVMSVASAKKLGAYTDSASVSDEFVTAVDVATQLGVLNGMTETEFGASGYLTRAQLAAIIYRLTTGDVSDKYRDNFVAGAAANFTDLYPEYWAAGYIGYCADAGYLEGWDGKFWAGEYMNGYQALAALLRAMGYNQPGEFSGSAWKVRVAQIATTTGVSTGVITDLNQPITREQFAQFIYNALFTSIVKYNTISGYEPTGALIPGTSRNENLAYKTFGVVSPKAGEATPGSDEWGRPATEWLNSRGTDVISIAYEADKTYTTMVDECDIAHDLGLTKATAIESAWIDGETWTRTEADVTSNRYATIDPYATTSKVGAQGRVTEVYVLADGTIRLVEINTYLATVSAIVPATTDKNGHPVDAYSILTVYVPEYYDTETKVGDERADGILYSVRDTDTNDDGDPVVIDGMRTYTLYTDDTSFAVGSYVLVTANPDSLDVTLTTGIDGTAASVKAATMGTTGSVSGYVIGVDNAITGSITMNRTTVYQDSDKFVYEYLNAADAREVADPEIIKNDDDNEPINVVKTVLNNADLYTAILDEYGNIIGLAPVSTNYLVIEAVRWIGDGTLYGGKAVADVMLANGTRVQNVTIAGVNLAASEHNGETPAAPAAATFDTSYADNKAYYNHVWAYSVNADGTYTLSGTDTHAETVGGNDAYGAAGENVNDLALATKDDATVAQGKIATGQTIVYEGDTAEFAVNDNTVFLLKDKDALGRTLYTYTAYVGKDNVPSLVDADVCYVMDAKGVYATLVIASDYTLVAGSKFVAYVDAEAVSGTAVDIEGAKYYAYNVWKLGETAPTVVYGDKSTGLDATNIKTDGLYLLTLDDKGALVSANEADTKLAVVDDENDPGVAALDDATATLVAEYNWDRHFITANNGQTMYGGAADNDNTYWVNNAKYFNVTVNADGVVLGVSATTFDQVNWTVADGQQVLVAYKMDAVSQTVKQADYVYVITEVANDPVSEVYHNTWTITLTQDGTGEAVVATFNNYDAAHDVTVAEVVFFYRVAGSDNSYSKYYDDTGWPVGVSEKADGWTCKEVQLGDGLTLPNYGNTQFEVFAAAYTATGKLLQVSNTYYFFP